MARDHGDAVKRPERVVIVDADDPLTEIHGEFVWLEEHHRAVEQAREAAYGEGFEAGRAADGEVRVYVARHQRPARVIAIAMAFVLALIVILMLPVVLL